MTIRFCLIIGVLLSVSLVVQAQDATPTPNPNGPTLKSILSRGQVNCGVNSDLLGFGYLDPNTGLVNGFDVDFCRALGAAIFGDTTAAATPLYSGDDGYAALQVGDVDVLFHNIVWNLAARQDGLAVGPVNFYNGQTIMVRTESNLDDWQTLDGQTICVTTGTNAVTAFPDAMHIRGLNFQLLTLSTYEDARNALADGRCQAQSADRVQLEVLRQTSNDPEGFLIWSGSDHIYTSEPYAPVYRYGDQQWADIVTWTMMGMIEAEQLDVNSENITDLVQQGGESIPAYIQRVGPSVAGLLNTDISAPGNTLGLSPNFMVDVIQEIGNYGEVYDRSLGPDSGLLNLQRDTNQLWRDGGLLYSPSWGQSLSAIANS